MTAFDLRGDGRVALITGGAGGIGRGVAEVFAAAGYGLVLADIDPEAGAAAAEAIGAEVLFVATDVGDEAQVEAAVAAGLERFGRIDFLYNNAGIAGRCAPIDRTEEADLERVLAVDLKAVFYTCKHVVPAMKKQGGGSILNVSSITADTGSAFYPAYGAAKAGVVALSRGLARNLGRHNIRVNCLSPGSVAGTDLMREYYDSDPEARKRERLLLTARIPVGRPGTPQDIGHFALFLASPLSAHVHGAVLTIDGGESLGFQ